MKQDRKEKKEIRDVLLGKTVLAEDGRLAVPEPGTLFLPRGVTDGAGAVRFLGIKGRERRYVTDADEGALMASVLEFMRGVGHGLYLREQPDTAACLIRYLLTRPAVLTFRYEDGQPTATAWSGRGFLSWLSRLRAVGALERALSEDLRFAGPEKTKKKRRKGRASPPEDAGEPEGYREDDAPEEWGDPGGEYWEDAPEESEIPDGGEYWEDSIPEDWEQEPGTTGEEDGEA